MKNSLHWVRDTRCELYFQTFHFFFWILAVSTTVATTVDAVSFYHHAHIFCCDNCLVERRILIASSLNMKLRGRSVEYFLIFSIIENTGKFLPKCSLNIEFFGFNKIRLSQVKESVCVRLCGQFVSN